ncbi:MAG: cation:proton antiporter [Actinomycetota bacterium]|nr:cation:proton antiporter [Actinomycetota bacterium]
MAIETIFLELGAILIALALVSRLATRVGLSPIPFYLLVGLAIGEGGVYSAITAEAFIQVGAEIGVVLLLLMLGLEYSPDELISGMRASAPVAAVDLVANFVPGFIAGSILGWGPVGSVLLGGVTYISSSGIVAKVIDDLGWLGNRESPMVLSLLVAEDLVMAAYLPMVGVLVVGGTVAGMGASVAVALLAAAVVLTAAWRWGEAISRLVLAPSNEALLLGVLGLTLLVAGAAERLHISAAVGAFLVGIAFSGPAQEAARGLLHPVRDLFAAIFFVFFGLSVDPRNIPPVLGVAAALAVVTAATKTATALWGAARIGVGPAGRRRAAAVLVARGEFSIVIAELGVASGLDIGIGPVAAAYVLLLAIAGPLAARAVA